MFLERQTAMRQADGFRRHDLVSLRVFQHTVLMDAAGMGKGIRANNRLVGLHGKTRNRRKRTRGFRDFGRIDAVRKRHLVGAGA